jgi:hypothetical protein
LAWHGTGRDWTGQGDRFGSEISRSLYLGTLPTY